MTAMTKSLQLTAFNPIALKTAALKTSGAICFALGTVGIVVPLLPTTVFWILAVTCFAKSAPELAERLMAHPRFGALLQDFVKHGVLSRQAKLFAIGGMGMSYGFGICAIDASAPVAAIVAAPMMLVALYLGLRREQAVV